MARIKKRKLGWAASTSPQVIGYKLYWAEGEKVGYDSPNVTLGNVTEIVLPDDVEGFNPTGGAVEFGITAMDELGNESDLITFAADHQFNVPQAPEDLWLKAMEEFHAPESKADPDGEDPTEPIMLFDKVASPQVPPAEENSTAESEETPTTPKAIQHYGHPDSN